MNLLENTHLDLDSLVCSLDASEWDVLDTLARSSTYSPSTRIALDAVSCAISDVREWHASHLDTFDTVSQIDRYLIEFRANREKTTGVDNFSEHDLSIWRTAYRETIDRLV